MDRVKLDGSVVRSTAIERPRHQTEPGWRVNSRTNGIALGHGTIEILDLKRIGDPGPARFTRALNVLVAAIGILLTAPVLLLIAIAIKITSPGPVLFVRHRVGQDRRKRLSNMNGHSRRRLDRGGRLFKMYKFRTMYDRRGSQAEVWARPDDDRITQVGRFLRRTRLDELPQLFNVLKGDMNVVGPRPEQPTIFGELRNQIDGYSLRQRVPPGITGLAQVDWRYDTSLEDVQKKLRYDLEYIQRRSVREDLRIMLKTLPVMVFGRGGW